MPQPLVLPGRTLGFVLPVSQGSQQDQAPAAHAGDQLSDAFMLASSHQDGAGVGSHPK